MRVALLAAAVLTLGAVSFTTAPAPRHFSVTVESTPSSWSATCDTGCSWSRASFACASACAAVLDANGIATVATPRDSASPFSFKLNHYSQTKVDASGSIGTNWQKLSWTCTKKPCRARITEEGVSTLE